MWKFLKSTSRGGTPARGILTYGLTLFLVAFLWIIFSSQTAFAADASWSGSNIQYEAKDYAPAKADKAHPPSPPIPDGDTYYRNIEATNSGAIMRAIYFPTGTKVDTATTAEQRVYEIDSSGNSKQVTDLALSLVPKTQSGNSSTKAVWLNGNLVYDGHTFTGDKSTFKTSDGTNPPLASGTKFYEFIDQANKKVSFLYFSSSTDPPSATSAQYITYDLGSNAVGNVTWSYPTKVTTVTIDAATTGNTNSSAASATGDSCNVDGIGWIVCPVSNFLAEGMDRIFDILKGFMMVEPISTQTTSPLYQAWNLMRGIANVAFVIVFLIIIYSQLTGAGIQNYGLKKLIPRLIVAALLVNLSYFICAIAVDLSNVTGSGLQEMLIGMRENIGAGAPHSIASWQSVTGFILADTAVTGAAAVTIGGVVISSGASLGAALILLLPMLLGLIIAVLVALIVLAARQALIVILIMLAPLAFVAYLLPNTEKLFERWREIFITMLVFFPLFALIFGGSQFAAFILIQTADGPNAINVILLAMFVQVAPLVLTPLLVKFSGGIIGRIAGFVNDPKKGLIDRTRNWVKGESEYLAARNMARRDPVRRRQVFRRFALGYDQERRVREGKKTAYNAWSDARWTNSRDFSNIDQLTREASDLKVTGESNSANRYSTWKSTTPDGRRVDTRLRTSQIRMENANHELEQQWEQSHAPTVMRERVRADVLAKSINQLKKQHEADFAELETGRVSAHLQNVRGINNYSVMAREILNRTNVATNRLSFAQGQQQVDFANLLKDNVAIAIEAGGIADQGAKRVRANAGAVITRAQQETIKAIKDATSVRSGDIAAMLQEIETAMAQKDVLSIRAYSDMLAESANPGIDALRGILGRVEATLTGDDLQSVKEHLNASAAVNGGAEDIGTWSRDTSGRTLAQVTNDVKTYNEMTPVGFASNKKSTQINAFRIGAVSPTLANSILTNPAARGNLKPSMQLALENIRAGRPWYEGVDVQLDED